MKDPSFVLLSQSNISVLTPSNPGFCSESFKVDPVSGEESDAKRVDRSSADLNKVDAILLNKCASDFSENEAS